MQFFDDVRYALRQFAHAPGFTATAVLTLALGIGATTAIFTLVHAVLLRSLPVSKPGELYRVGDEENCCVNGGLQDNWSLFSYDKYKTFRDGTQGFTELAGFQAGRSLIGVRRIGSNQPAESLRAQYVSGNYFTTFGVSAFSGRAFTPDDDRQGAEPVSRRSARSKAIGRWVAEPRPQVKPVRPSMSGPCRVLCAAQPSCMNPRGPATGRSSYPDKPRNLKFQSLSPFCHCCSTATFGRKSDGTVLARLTRNRHPIVFLLMKLGVCAVSIATDK